MPTNSPITTRAEMPSTDKGIAPPSTVKGFMALPSTQKRVNDLLGDRASNFMTSVSSMIGADDKLARCEPVSLFMACLTAAALNLSTNKNLGFAHIIPYDNNRAQVTEAQFQLGWRGYVQLAMRTGQYKTIAATAVFAGQLVAEDPLEGNTYDWKAKTSDEIIGYVASFTTTNGFRKEVYMSHEAVTEHAKRYSKAYQYDLKPTTKYKNSPWSKNFEAMALKTVIKQLISKWGIMSVDLEKALASDSAVIKEDGTPDYIDGELSNVNATPDKKAAILAANRPVEAVHEAKPAADEPTVAPGPDDETEEDEEDDTPAAASVVPPKSIKERAAEFVEKGKHSNKHGKQSTLVGDNDTAP